MRAAIIEMFIVVYTTIKRMIVVYTKFMIKSCRRGTNSMYNFTITSLVIRHHADDLWQHFNIMSKDLQLIWMSDLNRPVVMVNQWLMLEWFEWTSKILWTVIVIGKNFHSSAKRSMNHNGFCWSAINFRLFVNIFLYSP